MNAIKQQIESLIEDLENYSQSLADLSKGQYDLLNQTWPLRR
ncbi:hypothetical protein ACVRY7_09365 [Streptococcus ictaluri]